MNKPDAQRVSKWIEGIVSQETNAYVLAEIHAVYTDKELIKLIEIAKRKTLEAYQHLPKRYQWLMDYLEYRTSDELRFNMKRLEQVLNEDKGKILSINPLRDLS